MTDRRLIELANDATRALLAQRPVCVIRHQEEPRNGFPLPIKCMDPDVAGYITQQYRPLAILEYVNDVLSGEIASRQAKRKNATKEQS